MARFSVASALSKYSLGERNRSFTAFTAWLSGPVMLVRFSSTSFCRAFTCFRSSLASSNIVGLSITKSLALASAFWALVDSTIAALAS